MNTHTLKRFWEKVDKTGDCWLWIACTQTDGYGRFDYGDGLGTGYAHRFSYEVKFGPIPYGLQIDHTCRIRNCVNPYHLEAVTQAENLKRGLGPTAINAKKTHCSQGHEYTEENTYTDKRNRRSCRACKRDSDTRYRLRKKGLTATDNRSTMSV